LSWSRLYTRMSARKKTYRPNSRYIKGAVLRNGKQRVRGEGRGKWWLVALCCPWLYSGAAL
jgi:hypothetical protein